MTTRLAFFFGAILAIPTVASAQVERRLLPSPPATLQFSVTRLGAGAAPSFLGAADRDYRYPGFYAGVAAGLLLTLYASKECAGAADCPIRPVPVLLIATPLLGVVGALIGGMIPKSGTAGA